MTNIYPLNLNVCCPLLRNILVGPVCSVYISHTWRLFSCSRFSKYLKAKCKLKAKWYNEVEQYNVEGFVCAGYSKLL